MVKVKNDTRLKIQSIQSSNSG